MPSHFPVIEVREFGGPDRLQLAMRPRRQPGPGEVSVRMLAAGVSQADALIREGAYGGGPKPVFSPGYDLVGVVEAIGSGVSRVKPGDRVASLTVYGSYAAYVYVQEEELYPVPDTVDPVHAVALVLNYVTAYQMLRRVAKAEAGQSALIYGASGGVGTALLELGKLLGLTLTGTASSAKHELLWAYGARAVDYRHPDAEAKLRRAEPGGYDIALENTGGPQLGQASRLLRRGGRLVAYGVSHMIANGRRSTGQTAATFANMIGAVVRGKLTGRPTAIYSITDMKKKHRDWFAEDLAQLLEWLAQGRISPVLDSVLPLGEAGRAHEKMQAGGLNGKIVLKGIDELKGIDKLKGIE